MASAGGFSDHSLSTALEGRLGEFNLLQMVRLWLRQEAQPLHQAVRFQADPSAAFPGRAASAVQVNADVIPRLTITTPDFCVGSALGPLPEPFLEWMRDLTRLGQPAMQAFLDVFNNRINQLRYNMRAELDLGLNNSAPEDTDLADYLSALLGVSGVEEASQIPLPARSWLAMGDLLANSRHCGAALTQLLGAQLDCPVRLEPLVGAWQPIEVADQHRLGRDGRRLGLDTLLGHSAWDCAARVRLHIGPMSYAQMVELLPPLHTDGPDHAPEGISAREVQRAWRAQASNAQAGADHTPFEQLQGLVRLLLDRRQDVEIILLLNTDAQPAEPLSGRSSHAPDRAVQAGMRLGQTARLQGRLASTTGTAPNAQPKVRPTAPIREVRFLIPAFDAPAV